MQGAPVTGFYDFLAKVHYPGGPPFLITVIMVCCAIVAITAIIAVQWRKVRQATLEASLKSQMLERGMSPAEIEHVIRVSAKRFDEDEDVRRKSEEARRLEAAITADPQAATMEYLVSRGYETEDVERIASVFALSDDHPDARERKIADARLVRKLAEQGMDGEDVTKLIRARYENNGRVAV